MRTRIALTGQFASVDEDLTGRENLLVLARLYGYRNGAAHRRADELLEAFDLAEAATRLVKTYSGGMRRRLDLAASLILRPALLFLDEPTTGLDPRSRNQVWETIRELVREGSTVLLTTQYLEEADRLAHRIAVIDRGRLIAEGRNDDLKASLGQRVLRVRITEPDLGPAAQAALSEVLQVAVDLDADTGTLSARLPADGSAREDSARVAKTLAELAAADISVREVGIEQPSLDEVFLSLTETGRVLSNAREVQSA